MRALISFFMAIIVVISGISFHYYNYNITATYLHNVYYNDVEGVKSVCSITVPYWDNDNKVFRFTDINGNDHQIRRIKLIANDCKLSYNDYILYEDLMNMNYDSLVGKVVTKRSNRPFKSGEKEATVTGITINPYSGKQACTFKEDDSVVDCYQLLLKND